MDRAVAAGVHALVANGNTGEFYGLTMKEAETMVHAVAEQTARRCVLIGGVGRSVNDACALAGASRAALERTRSWCINRPTRSYLPGAW